MIKLCNLRDSDPGPAPNTVKSGERLPLTSEGFEQTHNHPGSQTLQVLSMRLPGDTKKQLKVAHL